VGLGVVTTVVHSGRFTGITPTIEKTLTAVGPDPVEGPVAAVDPDAAVCARFMTGRDVVSNGPWSQPDPTVRLDVGSFGEHLRGSPHVHVFGSLTKHPSLYLEVSRRMPVPTSTVLGELSSMQSLIPVIRPLAGFCAF
jgi:hypothetical protein